MVKKGKVSRLERRIKQRKNRAGYIQKQRAQFRKRQRNKKIFNYTLLGLVVIAVGTLLYAFFDTDNDGQHDALAQCLTQANVIMYGTDWCRFCQTQKQLFGRSFQYINYINCDLNADACELADVASFPTWTFSAGPKSAGVQELEVLAARTGCTDEA